MRYKGLIALLAIVISAISIYSLSFTWVSMKIQQEAEQYAIDQDGKVNSKKKQAFLAKKRGTVVHHRWYDYTLAQVQKKALGLGSDLQGGKQVILATDPTELIKSMAGRNSNDPDLLKVLAKTRRKYKAKPEADFLDFFLEVWEKNFPSTPLHQMFPGLQLSDKPTNQQVIATLKQVREKQAKDDAQVLRKRVNDQNIHWEMIDEDEYGNIVLLTPDSSKLPQKIGEVSKLSFHQVVADTELATAIAKKVQKISGHRGEMPLLQPTADGLMVCKEGDFAKVKKILSGDDIQMLFPEGTSICMNQKSHHFNETELRFIYLIRQNPDLQENIVKETRVGSHEGEPYVEIKLNEGGAKEWKKITANNVGKLITIVLDDRTLLIGIVDQEIPHGILQIHNISSDEAQHLASTLSSGVLSGQLKVVKTTTTAPMLSRSAQVQGLQSIIMALILIILLMLLCYAIGGLVAGLALGIHILFILGALAQTNVALTLAGIVAIVFSMLVFISTIALIFEQIRKELSNGLYIKRAIISGYSKAYSTTIGVGITTLLIGATLWLLNQGPIKSFGSTLVISTISALFTAVCCTHLIIEAFILVFGAERVLFSFGFRKNLLSNFSIDFFALRKIAYALSIFFIGIGTLLIYKQGGFTLALDSFMCTNSTRISLVLVYNLKKSMLCALVLIFLYTLFRFRRWSLSLSALIILLHDSLIVLTAVAIAGAFGTVYKMDPMLISAIIAVMSYSSINIVRIFDCIRANMELTDTEDLSEEANKTINEIMSYTLITSFISLITVFCLFIFGGAAFKGFSFALLIGIVSSTYSTIFIAAPLANGLVGKRKTIS